LFAVDQPAGDLAVARHPAANRQRRIGEQRLGRGGRVLGVSDELAAGIRTRSGDSHRAKPPGR